MSRPKPVAVLACDTCGQSWAAHESVAAGRDVRTRDCVLVLKAAARGPQGPAGPVGAMGAPGVQGPAGPRGTLSAVPGVGSVYPNAGMPFAHRNDQ